MQLLFRQDNDHAYRFGTLSRIVRTDKRTPLFVPQGANAELVRVHQFDGGRDVTYIVVAQRQQAESGKGPRVTIGYLPEVDGTSIIYDLTDETLQGKARPFECDLTRRGLRLYALLPVQIETIALAITKQPDPTLTIEFQDARSARLEATLPFRLRFTGNANKRGTDGGYSSTELHGRKSVPVPSGTGVLSVTSAATGREERMNYEIVIR
jgi:hypothetical protein